MKKSITDEIRDACQQVAEQAAFIRIDRERLSAYAHSLPLGGIAAAGHDPETHYLHQNEGTVAYFLTLNAVNFGSGYFPHLHKLPGKSGYFTIARRLKDRFVRRGPFAPEALQRLSAEECCRLFKQNDRDPVVLELMTLYAEALSELGRFVLERFNGSFIQLLHGAGGSAERLIEILAQMPFFRDVSRYRGIEVPFFKRAQITAADLALAFDNRSWGAFHDLHRLTIFADNLVPHVLRVDGILVYPEWLVERIDAGELIPPGAAEEIEIRACALDAVESLRGALSRAGIQTTSTCLDHLLWNRGQHPSYKAVPRHRTRTVFY